MTQPTPQDGSMKGRQILYSLTHMAQRVRFIDYKTPIRVPNRFEKLEEVEEENEEKISRARRGANLNAAKRKVHDIISCNIGDGIVPIFLTFTYKVNQGDLDVAWEDWRRFIRKLNKHLAYSLKYLVVVEFQKRGAVHFHTIFFNLPIEYERSERRTRLIARLWSHGFVDVEEVRKARSVASYVTKYLSKGADDERVWGRRFFSCSKGLKRPIKYYNTQAWHMMQDIENGLHEIESKTIDERGNIIYIVKVLAI